MRVILILAVVAMLLGLAVPAGATLLSDLFGVTLSVNGAGAFNNSWVPVTSTADYFVYDNWSTYFARTHFDGGVPLGFASFNYYEHGLVERGYSTYVFEPTVPGAALKNSVHGDAIGLTWSTGCSKDVIHLDATLDADPVVPEPGTMLLLGSGLLGVVGVARRRRK